jgi:hypothetical protein
VRIRTSVAIGTLCALTFVGCGGDDGPAESTNEPPAEPEENRVEIGMSEYAFGMPETITGGSVTLEFTNNGELPHEAAFGSIAGDHDLDDVKKAIESGQQPSWFKDLAGIPILDSGATTSMTRDLEPGRYIFLCFLPVPGKGTPHVNEGMVQIFDAEGTTESEGPEPDLSIVATDDGFDVPEISAGTHAIELVNDGSKPHEFVIVSFEPGKTVDDVEKWFQSGFKTEKPAVLPGGLQSIDPGTSVVVEMTFDSGRAYTIQDFENRLEANFEVK